MGVVALCLFGILDVPVLGAGAHYRLLKEIPIGGDGGWDYLSIDEAARRLYVPHAGTRRREATPYCDPRAVFVEFSRLVSAGWREDSSW